MLESKENRRDMLGREGNKREITALYYSVMLLTAVD
jgi:hypothetical protein